MSLHNLQVELAELIVTDSTDTTHFYPLENIAIYKNNLTITLTKSLKAVYPLILALVGPKFFDHLAKHYVASYPSRSSNLHDYGEYMSEFLMVNLPQHKLVYLSEVATFEWACHRLQFAATAAPLDIRFIESLSSEDYPRTCFNLCPAIKLMACQYPLLKIIALCQGETEETVNLDEAGVNLLIMRRDGNILFQSLSLGDYIFLKNLADGMTLSFALDEALQVDAQFNLSEKLCLWIEEKILVECYVAA